MLHADRPATGRADKFDLTAGIDLSHAYDMRGPTAGTGDFISVAGHTIGNRGDRVGSPDSQRLAVSLLQCHIGP